MGEETGDIILEMKNISKSFPGVQALRNASFYCRKGEVKALVGEMEPGNQLL